MNPRRATNQAGPRPNAARAPITTESTRKPWKKKTPVQVVLDQINKVRESVALKEEELNQAKRELEKLEEAKKLLESD
jgi:hypothetical protein